MAEAATVAEAADWGVEGRAVKAEARAEAGWGEEGGSEAKEGGWADRTRTRNRTPRFALGPRRTTR